MLSLAPTHQTINGKRLQYLGCSSLLVQGVGQRCPEVGQRRGLRRAHLQRWGLLRWCRPWPETIRPWAEVSLPTELVPDLNDPLPTPTFLARNYLIRDQPSMTQVPTLNWLLPTPSWKWFDCRLTFHGTGSRPQSTPPHSQLPCWKWFDCRLTFHGTTSRPQLTLPHSHLPCRKWFDCRLTFHDTSSRPQLTTPHTHPLSVQCKVIQCQDRLSFVFMTSLFSDYKAMTLSPLKFDPCASCKLPLVAPYLWIKSGMHAFLKNGNDLFWTQVSVYITIRLKWQSHALTNWSVILSRQLTENLTQKMGFLNDPIGLVRLSAYSTTNSTTNSTIPEDERLQNW